MTKLINIHFIVNPISGSGKANFTLEFLNSYFSKDNYQLSLKYSTYKRHAITLTKASISEKANIIVACGGDGTINEVASCLVNSSIKLGIVPMGSGNGLASHLKIPKNIDKALKLIQEQFVTSIDVGSNNGTFFFSNTGIGFDARVINYYEALNKRKLLSYFKSCIKALSDKDKKQAVIIDINGHSFKINPFLVFTSNSNELGYNLSLTPKASLQDGQLDVLIVSKLSLLRALLLGILVMFKKHHLLSNVTSYKTKSMRISHTNSKQFLTQIDGESHTILNKTLDISILENALKVIVNR